MQRIRDRGALEPEAFVDLCLDLLGPLETLDTTREQLAAMARRDGGLKWDTEEEVQTSTRRVGDMFGLIASTREYQFA